jgi:hypothetical protein
MEKERHKPLAAQKGATLTTTALGRGRISRVARILSVAVVAVVTSAAEQELVPSTLGSMGVTRTTPRVGVLAAAM